MAREHLPAYLDEPFVSRDGMALSSASSSSRDVGSRDGSSATAQSSKPTSSSTTPSTAATSTSSAAARGQAATYTGTLHLQSGAHGPPQDDRQANQALQAPEPPTVYTIGALRRGKAYHRECCGMVRKARQQRPQDVQAMRVTRARVSGLNACKQCNPDLIG